MKLRKLTAFILTLVIAASMFSAFALAEGEPTFRGDNIEARAGETITYKVYIENNPGIAGYKVQVDFSEEAFDLDSADATDEFQNPIKIRLGDFCRNEDGDLDGNVVGNPTKYGAVALYFNIDNIDSDGCIFTVTLKVKDDAVNGTHAVKIRYDARNTVYVDETGEVVYAPEFKTVDGSVTVTGGEDGVINNDAVGPTEEELKQIEEERNKITSPNVLHPSGTDEGEIPIEGEPNNSTENPKSEEQTAEGENSTDGQTNNTQLTNDGTTTGEAAGTVTNRSTAGNGVTKIVLIAAAAVIVVIVILVFVLKALAGKKPEATDSEDKDIDINEILGLNPTEDDYNDGDEDDEDDLDD